MATTVLAAGISVTAATPASAEWYADGVFSLKYTDEIWYVDSAQDGAWPITYDEWESIGFPTPEPARTDFVKYPWSSTISAVTFFGDQRSEWLWEHVSFDQWSRAGFPAPRNAGWIEDSYFYQWGTSNELFVQDVGGVNHKLTYNEWRDSGFEPANLHSNEGFIKLSWDSTIVRLTDAAGGQGYAVSYDEWRHEGFPTPKIVQRVPGDQVYRNYGSSTVWYAGPGVNRPISYGEWQALGFPSPRVDGTPVRPADKDCKDFPSQAAAQQAFTFYYEAYGDVFGLDADGDRRVCEAYKY